MYATKAIKANVDSGNKRQITSMCYFKILKSEIEGEGIPNKGTPQGGIISPLLSNIVLNELDWWISSQWETYKPHRISTRHLGFRQYARKYTNLKCGYVVRYADDFKIMCRTYDEAQRFYHATVDFLKSRLGLEINPKSPKWLISRKTRQFSLDSKSKWLNKVKLNLDILQNQYVRQSYYKS